jgi:hypothetical protein
VVGLDGELHLAPGRSEHLDCAAGRRVIAAGEVPSAGDGAGVVRQRESNQSTGYCLTLIPGQQWPRRWTGRRGASRRFHAHGRLPPLPGLRPAHIVRDGNFACAVRGSALPSDWNISPA